MDPLVARSAKRAAQSLILGIIGVFLIALGLPEVAATGNPLHPALIVGSLEIFIALWFLAEDPSAHEQPKAVDKTSKK